jgi:endonuclease YncB( thermonuclease family)
MIEALKSMYMNTTGRPVTVDFESDGRPRRMIIEPGATFDGNFYGATNVRIDGSAIFDPGMKNIGNILQQAVILDYETTSKFGGAVITEASAYHVDQNLVKTFYVKPYHMVTVGDGDFFEQAQMSSKKTRQVKTIKSNVTPRGHFASFFTRHLSDIFLSEESRSLGYFINDFNTNKMTESFEKIVKTPIFNLSKASEDLQDMFVKLHTGQFKNRLEFEEAILTLDRQKKIFDKGAVRDELLKYTSVVDKFQTRYYVNSAEEASRLGITSTLFTKAENRQIFDTLSYLRAEGDIGVADLQKRTEDIFRDRFGRPDIAIQAEQVDIEDLIFKRLPQEIEGKSLYASNVLFESKQTGATIRGIVANQLFKEDPNFINLDPDQYNARIRNKLVQVGNPFEEVMQAVSYTGDPFYTTGKEYTYAKSLATKENTYADLFETFVKTTEGPGRARDIIDLQKMTQGATQRMGLNDIEHPLGMSVEVQSRLFGAAQEISQGGDAAQITRQLLEKEAHISASDAAISSPKIMQAALPFNVAAEEFRRGSELGRAYYKQALEGRGPLLGLFAYGELTKKYFSTVGPDDLGLADIHFEQRVARNLESVLAPDNLQTFGSVKGYKLLEMPTFRVDKQGNRIQDLRTTSYAKTQTYMGIEGVYSSAITDAKKYPGVDPEAAIHRLFEKVNRDEVLVEFDEKQGRYVLPEVSDPKEYSSKLRSRVKAITESNAEQVELFARRSSSNIIDDVMNTLRASDKASAIQRTSVSVGGRSSLDRAIGAHETLKFAKRTIAPVMAFGLAMSGLSTLERFQQPERSSYLIPSYHDWFASQAEMFGGNESFVRSMQQKTGYIEGMQESGMSSMLRKMSSDFGSPYTGPGYSDLTLERGEILRERQRKLRHMYTERHLAPTGDIKGMISSFIRKSFSPQELNYQNSTKTLLNRGSFGAEDYTSLKGKNLTKVTLSNNYNISVQDADTITLKRNYGSGGMKNFFSGRKSNKPMSIRLAGIDAPETAHQGRGAQPYAEAAKRIAQDMISRAKNVEVVFDEGDSTYGRRVGMVYADGVNVNLELIKRGAAAYLPYRGKQKSTIYDNSEFSSAQESAYQSKRGMWRSDYFRSYKQIAQESGQTVTFNTLVNTSKVAQNTSLMTMYSAMKTSEAFGMQNTVAQQATADAGLALKNKASRSGSSIFKPDYMKNEWTEPNLMGMHQTNSILTGMNELKYDLNKSIKTKGGYAYNKHSALRVKSLDLELAAETTSAKYNSFNKDYLFNTKELNKKRHRIAAMQFLQQRQNNKMFSYSSGHHRM